MILAPHTLPEEVAFVLEQAVTALSAAAKDGSEVAHYGLEEVKRCLSYIGGDIEVYADHEEGLRAMYAEVNVEEYWATLGGTRDDDLPPIIKDEGLEQDFWGEAA